SRRLYTRSKRDWSSDVCSSDLDTRPFYHLFFSACNLKKYIRWGEFMIVFFMFGMLAFVFCIGYLLVYLIRKVLRQRPVFRKKVFFPLLIGSFLFIGIGTATDDDASAKVTSLEEEKEALESDVADLEEETEELQVEAEEDASDELDDMSKELDSLKEDYEKQEKDNKKSEKESKTKEEEDDDMKEEKKELKKHLKKAKKETKKLEEDKETLKKQKKEQKEAADNEDNGS